MVLLWRIVSGDSEPDYGDNFHREGLSGEELREFRESENKMYEAFFEERKQIQRDKSQQKVKGRKEA